MMDVPEWLTGGGFGAGLLALIYWFASRSAAFLKPMLTDLYATLKDFISSTKELQTAIQDIIIEHDRQEFAKLDHIHEDVKATKQGVDGLHQKLSK